MSQMPSLLLSLPMIHLTLQHSTVAGENICQGDIKAWLQDYVHMLCMSSTVCTFTKSCSCEYIKTYSHCPQFLSIICKLTVLSKCHLFYAVFVKIKELAVAKSNTPGPKLNLPLKEICDIRFSSRDMKSASCSAEFTRCSTDSRRNWSKWS